MNKVMSQQSKTLSYVLRHAPEKAGLALGPGGWVNVEALLAGLAAMGESLSSDDLRAIVETSDKKRFTLSEDGRMIRAAQGHSVDVDLELQPSAPPETLYHGTATRFLDAVLAEGLRPMARVHVHLSGDVETALKVGGRHGKPIVLAVDAKAMADAGRAFFKADSGVWLTDQVPPEFLSERVP